MIKVYFLSVITIDNTEQVTGEQYIHDALLLATEVPTIRQLIMDTNTVEHTGLSLLCFSHRDPTQAEIDLYNTRPVTLPPSPDTIRAQQLLALSPSAITAPQMWQLLRIFGRRLGYRF